MTLIFNSFETKKVRKNEVWLADLGPKKGSKQSGVRPVLITTNNVGCSKSSIIQVAPITSSTTKRKMPTHVHITAENNGFIKDSTIMFEQLFPLDKKEDLKYKLFDLPEKYDGELFNAYVAAYGY
ncbi:type II toxin-antitoxin system PemK/MazF family toxin [Paenibacillus sp. FSL E2-0178]|uniref:type II toxin-antitoxin system PemK/MazF family toxin n=1 Tax=Paenibacillus sp. FSL E2-0178 TaxID=2921361 RepID=UPI00315825DA